MGVQITPGQRCLLEILQRKLIGTIQEYIKFSKERKDILQMLGNVKCYLYDSDGELTRLKEKIKRISARQKRFTSEILNGNGNNTIPKENFLKALGLVTRETLQQINSKSNERRRRTTANPRFSHEAIQAKKALQKPRIEPRVPREKRNAARAISRVSSRRKTSPDEQLSEQLTEQLTEQEKVELYAEFKQLALHLELRADQVKKKLENKKRLDDDAKFRAEKALAELRDQIPKVESPQSDTWMRCDESLDGID